MYSVTLLIFLVALYNQHNVLHWGDRIVIILKGWKNIQFFGQRLQNITNLYRCSAYSMSISATSLQRMAIFLLHSLNEWFIKNLISVILNAYLCEAGIRLDLQRCVCVQKSAQLKDLCQLRFGIWGLLWHHW